MSGKNQQLINRRSLLFVLGGALALLTMIFCYWEDFHFAEEAVQYVDFRNSFYVAGTLVREGRIAELYPHKNDLRFHDTAFNAYAHQLLPRIPATQACNFLYPPLVAYFFAPLSLLPPRLATFVWQLLSVLALIMAVFFFKKASNTKYQLDEITAASFLAFPLLHVLLTGQLAIVFGVLPLAAGYYFCRQKCFFLAGIAWSLMLIKPQLFFPLGCVMLAKIVSGWLSRHKEDGRDNWIQAQKLLGGACIGSLLFLLVPFAMSGPQAIGGWLQATSMVAASATNPANGWAQHTVISLPAAVSFLSPENWARQANFISFLVSLIAAMVLFLVLIRDGCCRRSANWEQVLVVAMVFLPLVAPYLRYYDYALFLFPFWIAWNTVDTGGKFWLAARRSLLVMLLTLNCYWMVLWMLGKQPPASAVTLPLVVIVFCCIYLIKMFWLKVSAEAGDEVAG